MMLEFDQLNVHILYSFVFNYKSIFYCLLDWLINCYYFSCVPVMDGRVGGRGGGGGGGGGLRGQDPPDYMDSSILSAEDNLHREIFIHPLNSSSLILSIYLHSSSQCFRYLFFIYRKHNLRWHSMYRWQCLICNLKTLKPWNLETLKPWNLETLKPWNLETLKPWNLETLKPWNLETLKP